MARRALAIAAALAVAAPAVAQPPTAPRTEVAITAVRLSDGVIRYGVPLTVGGRTVLAGLDTGAAGLRLMPDAASAEVARGASPESYSFGSGARLAGVTGRARIAIGELTGEASLHLVEAVDCIPSRPQCPGRLGLGYGFLGDGLPGEGFRVLLGGNMGRGNLEHPLTAVGARRWIIDLPRPNEQAGRLVLNPSDAEAEGFTFLRLAGGFREEEGGGLHDAVSGCLVHAKSGRRVCGLMTLDTGAFMIRVLNDQTATPWPAGDAATIELLGQDRKPAATMPVTIGATAQAVAPGSAPRRETIIQLGTAPYFAWSVLYDPGRRRIGFKPRPG